MTDQFKHLDTALAAIKACQSVSHLASVVDEAQERIKDLAAEELHPGTDEVIEDLDLLDYIWKLKGDRVWSSKQTEPYRYWAIEHYLGRKVEHIWGVGTIVRMNPDSKMSQAMFGIEVDLPCNCGKTTKRVYARPGCHTGAFCYVYSQEGEFLADLRNQWFSCDDCLNNR